MADTAESSVLKVVFVALASPAVQKICESWDIVNDIGELQRSLTTEAEGVVVEEDEDDVNGGEGGLRFQLKKAAYEAEDLIHNLTIIAANLVDSGNQRSESYDDLDLDLDEVSP
ncbi:hypothetical protein TorRG33x02_104580 [Trema orientale]|uniref:Rx N-terminal domain-containing protein n=1 Tax=Trema orientale TaxID=63057 RepID=A0A2P5F7J5_TREOI|nr:hypothetical protein TorRG33x02_104580 [Trema orientale]